MNDRFDNLNYIWAGLMVDELVRNGAECFCMASGSRSAPLALAMARHPSIHPVIHCDERATAFFALGHARATGRPAVWVTTSGTAVANGLPAVIEASQDRVPLILITADRPPEMRDCGSNQTIDQVNLFGRYSRWQFDMPCPDTDIPAEMILTTVDQAYYRATRSPAGPVHINCMFREPLAPEPDGGDYHVYMDSLRSWRSSGGPFTRYSQSVSFPEDRVLDMVLKEAEEAGRGIIVLGKLEWEGERESVRALLGRISWPVLADVTSGFRLGCDLENIIPYYDHILLDANMCDELKPDFIWHIGGAVTSKRLQEFIRDSGATYIVMKNHPLRQDPYHKAEYSLETDPSSVSTLMNQREISFSNCSTLNAWKTASGKINETVTGYLSNDGPPNEPSVARSISTTIPADHGLFMANSMPIRDMDMYAGFSDDGPSVAANRGASGIDGIISTAAGYTSGLGAPVTLLIGDLAFIHDMASLRLLKELNLDITVVLLNNNGGAIFSFLPVAAFGKEFETCFGTPHDLTFEHAARLFALTYHNPASQKEFDEVYRKAVHEKGPRLIEVNTTRPENLDVHQAIRKHVIQALEEG